MYRSHDKVLQLFPLYLSLLVIVFFLGVGISVIFQDVQSLPLYISDDAFYYLQIARTFATEGIYSFDGGYSTNSGFHVLWFYCLVILALLAANTQVYLLSALVLNFLISLATLWVILPYLNSNRHLLPVFTVIISSYCFVNGQYALMEWSLSILVSSLIYRTFYRQTPSLPRPLLLIFSLGMLGSLARTDFLGVAVSFLAAAWVVHKLKDDKRYIHLTLMLLVGSIVGTIMVLFHSNMITGDWLQTSAKIKAAWGELVTPNLVAPMVQFSRVLFYVPSLTGEGSLAYQMKILDILQKVLAAGSLIAGFSAIYIFAFRKSKFSLASLIHKLDPGILLLIVASLLSIFGYLLVYSLIPLAMQSWYTAQVFIPIAFLFACIYNHFSSSKSALVSTMTKTMVLLIVVFNTVVFAFNNKPYPAQASMAAIGVTIKEAMNRGDISHKVGISDAGIAGFFSEGNVVNTDGLVNSDIFQYFPDRLPCYLLDKKLRYINGFGFVAQYYGPRISWEKFSKPKVISSNHGSAFTVKEIDFEKLAMTMNCSN
jgi:hypothetical protein